MSDPWRERREIGNAVLYCGDALEVLGALPDESVHCCVTSPPYWGLRDYGVPGQLGLESTPAEYVEKMVAIFREVRRVLRDDGTLWLNLGDSYHGSWGNSGSRPELDGKTLNQRPKDAEYLPRGGWDERRERPASSYKIAGLKPKDLVGIPWRVAFALQADGWYLRQDIIWAKPNPMPESVTDRCTKSHEYLFLLAKSARYYFDADAIAEPTTCERMRGSGPMVNSGTGRNDAESGTVGDYRKRTKGKHSTQDPQSAGHRMVESVARARVEGADHDNPFGATRNKRSVWTVTTKACKEAHFATFPPALIEPCVLAGCPVGGTVLDPFIGSGTAGEVALLHSRKFVGIELNTTYFTDFACERVENAQRQQRMFP